MCSLREPLKEGAVGWLRKMSHPALDLVVNVEKMLEEAEGEVAHF